MEYNVAKTSGETMLLCWVNRERAQTALKHYLEKYPPGGAYPNGKGLYPDWGFHIVSRNLASYTVMPAMGMCIAFALTRMA